MTMNSLAAAERIGGPERASEQMLDGKAVAAILNCSHRHVERLAAAGRIPRPVKLGQLVRWRRSEIISWMKAGCPSIINHKKEHTNDLRRKQENR